MLLGNKIRSLRDEQGILQRQVAAYLEIDTPMFSKIERGDRRAKRSQVIQMATYFKVDEKEMLTLWLADKVLDALEGEDELKITAIETAKAELTDNRWFAVSNSNYKGNNAGMISCRPWELYGITYAWYCKVPFDLYFDFLFDCSLAEQMGFQKDFLLILSAY